MNHKGYLDELNEQQRAAVEYCEGPQLVIAGAGSGKTRVLTYKIVHLLSLGYEPWRLMALTFTNKAAKEMRERIERLVGTDTASKLWMGTFHSLFARILRIHADRIGYKPNYTIYDAADSKSLVKSIIKDLQLDDKIYKPATISQIISSAKNALISPESYRAYTDLIEADRRAKRPETSEIYRIYRNRCVAAGAMDFDDLLYYTNVLLRDNPDILHHYQERFRYILVDEYQDTNLAQHAIITRLCESHGKLCVVGDDAQSIYSFRGANIRNILNLRNTYSDLRIFKLEQNYRSTQTIIGAAGSLIGHNREQIPKNVFSKGDVGTPIEIAKAYSDYEESYIVANRIQQLKRSHGDSYDEFAILYRTNAQSRVLEESLRSRNIPYRIYGGLSFYQRKEVKDAIAYFRLSINPDDDEALRRVINFPARGIGETTLAKLVRAAIDNGRSIWWVICNLATVNPGLNSGTVKKLDGFRSLIEEFISLNHDGNDAYSVAETIIRRTELLKMLLTEHTPENISKRENLQELLSGVKQFVEDRREEGASEASLANFMAEAALATDQDNDQSAEGPRVTLMTVHAAKGLEFANVFVVGNEEDLFPSAMVQSMQDLEEERRLLYVAITRAKRFCMLSHASSRFRNGQTMTCRPSRFLKDIDSRFLKRADNSGAGAPRVSTSGFHTFSNGYSAPLRNFGGASRQQPSKPKADTGDFRSFTATELSEGMKVVHNRFGEGTIIRIITDQADHRIIVDFDSTGEKTVLLKYAKLKLK